MAESPATLVIHITENSPTSPQLPLPSPMLPGAVPSSSPHLPDRRADRRDSDALDSNRNNNSNPSSGFSLGSALDSRDQPYSALNSFRQQQQQASDTAAAAADVVMPAMHKATTTPIAAASEGAFSEPATPGTLLREVDSRASSVANLRPSPPTRERPSGGFRRPGNGSRATALSLYLGNDADDVDSDGEE